MSELRTDPLTGEAVILAPGRSGRPHSHRSDGAVTRGCPFCPANEDQTPPAVLKLPIEAGAPGWFVRVFPNLYPIVAPPGDGSGNPTGAHEVIVETPVHDQELSRRTPAELRLTLAAYHERLNALLARSGIRYVTVFRNQGAPAGASLAHPHSQVVALSYVPRMVATKVRRWRRHLAQTGRCLLCDEIEKERSDGTRVVFESPGFVVYAPRGGVMPGELVLAPLAHATHFAHIDDATLTDLSSALLDASRRLASAFDDPACNLIVQTWPKSRLSDPALHWYLRIVPRRTVIGGFELATGDLVSTLSPEDAAARYREAGTSSP